MKNVFTWFLGLALVFFSAQAMAETHYTQNEFKTAESLDAGMSQAGVQFSIGDHYKSYYPAIRYGLGAMFEIGVKAGAVEARIDTEDKLGLLVGGDIKFQLVKEAEGVPVDLAFDLGVDNTIIKSMNVTEVTFSTIISKSFPLTDRGYKLVPYGGLAMSEVQGSLVNETNMSKDTSFYGFGGIVWKLSQKAMFLLEVKSGPTTLGGIGLRFEY